MNVHMQQKYATNWMKGIFCHFKRPVQHQRNKKKSFLNTFFVKEFQGDK